MKPKLLLTGILLAFTAAVHGQSQINPAKDGDVSLKLEIERAIAKGVEFLDGAQTQETGAWSDESLPAISALAISAIMGDPSREPGAALPESASKGYDFLLSKVQDDGGIYGRGLATYNTALSIMALVQSGQEAHLPVIAKARRLLVNQQQDFDKRGVTDNLFDGGIGYGGSSTHSDLSNSHFAMEALYYSKRALADTKYDETADFDLNWDAAIEFVSRVQNSERTAKILGGGVGVREEDEGGFVYYPGDSKAGEIELILDGEKKTALRSYGSMTYAGLLAFIYADMSLDDPRVQAALSWLRRNYTLVENPGMDAQGLYYYYHTMAKALAIANVAELKTPEGKMINWKEDLALEVMRRQKRDGSWINDEANRWMENNPVLVTAYSVLTLENIYRSL